MARPILVVKNLTALVKNITYAKKAGLCVFDVTTPSTKKAREQGDFSVGQQAVRQEFGLPYALLDAINAQANQVAPDALALLGKVVKVLYEGNRFDPQKLQRLKAAAAADKLTDQEFVAKVSAAIA